MTIILEQIHRLQTDFGLSAVTASEIEFYLHGSDGYKHLPELWADIQAACSKARIGIFKIEKEKGREQHEIALMPFENAEQTAIATITLQSIIGEFAAYHGLKADFAAKPLPDQPGSGLHFHIHLADQSGKNVFYKDDDSISDPLKYSIGGLLAYLPESMPVFAPQDISYARFTPGDNAPTTISWGANNRTVAIRLPDSAHDNKRIEHRMPGSDADPGACLAVMLAGMHYGLANQCEPGPQIYGDAALDMYQLPPLVKTLSEAKEQAPRLFKDYPELKALLP